jgi:ankyrin repeat protein
MGGAWTPGKDRYGLTALHYAVLGGHRACVETLHRAAPDTFLRHLLVPHLLWLCNLVMVIMMVMVMMVVDNNRPPRRTSLLRTWKARVTSSSWWWWQSSTRRT